MSSAAAAVTIGVPVYNGERHLGEALSSLLRQTHESFELLISDNASTDGTEEIGRSVAAADARVRYDRHDVNRGAAWNFNHVFELGTGRYFKWAADDDVYEETYLERCVDVLRDDDGVVWTQSLIRGTDADGGPLVEDGQPVEDMSYLLPRSYESALDRSGRPLPTRAGAAAYRRFRAVLLETIGDGNWDVFGLIRTSAMRRTALQLPFYGGDKVFVAHLSLLGRFDEVPEPLFRGRVHPEASSALLSSEEQRQWISPVGPAHSAVVRLRLVQAYLRAIRTSDLPGAEQARCVRALAGYLAQGRKWRAVVERTLRGRGTGGGYEGFLTEADSGGGRP